MITRDRAVEIFEADAKACVLAIQRRIDQELEKGFDPGGPSIILYFAKEDFGNSPEKVQGLVMACLVKAGWNAHMESGLDGQIAIIIN